MDLLGYNAHTLFHKPMRKKGNSVADKEARKIIISIQNPQMLDFTHFECTQGKTITLMELPDPLRAMVTPFIEYLVENNVHSLDVIVDENIVLQTKISLPAKNTQTDLKDTLSLLLWYMHP